LQIVVDASQHSHVALSLKNTEENSNQLQLTKRQSLQISAAQLQLTERQSLQISAAQLQLTERQSLQIAVIQSQPSLRE
jgi:hypothetical protein